MRAAVAVELVHSATLVHDDVIDGALLRRGRPTVAAAAGRGAAVATGDLLFSRAFAELARNDDPAQLQRALPGQLRAGRRGAAAARGRLRRARRGRALPAPLRAEDRGAVRGRLPARRAHGGARARRALADALGAFAREIGLAFQLLDDVLDVSGPVERTGKARGTDLLDGTVTLPFILARERDPSLADVRPDELGGPAPGGGAVRADRGDRRARRGARARAGARRGGEGLAAGDPAGRALRAARAGRRRGRRALPLRRRGGSLGAGRRWGALEVAREDQVGLEGPGEELDFLRHVRVRHAPQVAEQGAASRGRARRRAVRRRPGRTRPPGATRTRGSGARSASAAVLPRTSPAGRPARPRSGSRCEAVRARRSACEGCACSPETTSICSPGGSGERSWMSGSFSESIPLPSRHRLLRRRPLAHVSTPRGAVVGSRLLCHGRSARSVTRIG